MHHVFKSFTILYVCICNSVEWYSDYGKSPELGCNGAQFTPNTKQYSKRIIHTHTHTEKARERVGRINIRTTPMKFDKREFVLCNSECCPIVQHDLAGARVRAVY